MKSISLILLMLLGLLSACEENKLNSQAQPATKADQKTALERGASLFQQTQFKRQAAQQSAQESAQGVQQALGCIICHRLDEPVNRTLDQQAEQSSVAPSLVGLGIRAKHVVVNMSAENYLRTSITNPDAHIVMGYEPNIMPNNYAQVLSEDEINALVVYLLSL